MFERIKNITSTREELKSFGYLFSFVLAIAAGFMLFTGGDYVLFWLTGSVLFLVSSLLYPDILLPLHKIWMALAVVLGRVMSTVILGAIFYFLLTPISFLGRLVGKQFLSIRFEDKTESYWNRRKDRTPGSDEMEKQY